MWVTSAFLIRLTVVACLMSIFVPAKLLFYELLLCIWLQNLSIYNNIVIVVTVVELVAIHCLGRMAILLGRQLGWSSQFGVYICLLFCLVVALYAFSIDAIDAHLVGYLDVLLLFLLSTLLLLYIIIIGLSSLFATPLFALTPLILIILGIH